MHRLLLALALVLGMVPLGLSASPLEASPAAAETAAPFTLAVIPDTRGYGVSDELAATAKAQTQWVADHADDLDIAFTVQTGDLVEDAQDEDQWARISAAFETLDTSGVPYAVVPGDHDTDLATGETSAYDEHFPASRFRDATWNTGATQYGGNSGTNTFDLFTAGGVDWLLLNLELESPGPVLDWAQQVLDAHHGRRVILTTHRFVDTRGWRTGDRIRSDSGAKSADEVWNEFVHRNCSIDFVLSGHTGDGDLGEARRTDPNACGQPVQQLESDYEDRPDGGDGLLRYYTFDPAHDKVDAFTYSVTRRAFETDADSRFTLPYDFTPSTADEVVVPGGSTWKYRTQQGAWPTGWDSTTYADTAWSSGVAPLGFNAGMVRTNVDLGPPTTNRAPGLLFRRTFDLTDPTHVSRLRLVTKADDGLVVRVNGQEVGRSYVPAGQVGATTKATAAPRSMAAQQVVYDVPLCLLKATGNVIAASVHLNDLSTTDAHFDLVAVATRSAEATPAGTTTTPQNVTLVAANAPWRWRFNTSAWPTGWTSPTFSDATWSQGAAPLGFGATVGTNIDVPPPTSNRPRSALFRRTFEIDDVDKYSNLQLTSRADDGVLLTVNGTEVNRTRLPTGTLSSSTYASAVVTTSAATASPVVVSIPKSLLRNGTNVIAAATVLNYKGTPNATFAAGLTAVRATATTGCGSAPGAPTLRVDSTTSDEVRLAWTPASGTAATGWTLTRGGTTIAQLPGTATSYIDTGLSPGRSYAYSLVASSPSGASSPGIVNATTTAAGQPVTLLPAGSAWRYQFSATWPTGWSATAFDDSTWRIGPAPLGFGASGLATNLDVPPPTSNRPRSALLRSTFDVPDRSRLSNLVLTTRADDGVVVYVNGQEVGRSNAPAGAVTATTYANAAPRTTQAALNPVRWTVPASVLQNGPNAIAVVTLLNYKGTPDLSFDLSLTASESTPPTEPAPAPGTCGSQAPFAPTCGVLWGIYTLEGADPVSAVTDLETEVGRRFDLALRYHDFSTHANLGVFPDAYERVLGTDRTLFITWQARIGTSDTDIRWADIADGKYDAIISAAATRMKDWNRPVVIGFDPEFDNLIKQKGPVADYVRAYRRVVEMFRRAGVTNVAWAWVPTGFLGEGNDARMLAGYPGDAYVDWVGYDPYNFFRCTGAAWKTFEQTIAPTYQWLVGRGLDNKPFVLSEYGTQYDADNPTLSTDWYAAIPEVLRRYPNLKSLIRFDADGVVTSGARCGLWIDNGPGMKDAFAAAGRNARLRVVD